MLQYCQYCTKFVQLILRKIIKIVATRCHILRLKCTRFDFGWGSAPDPAGGAHSAPPDSLTGFEGVLLLKEGKGREGKGREGKGMERKEGKEEGCDMGFGGMDAPAIFYHKLLIFPRSFYGVNVRKRGKFGGTDC